MKIFSARQKSTDIELPLNLRGFGKLNFFKSFTFPNTIIEEDFFPDGSSELLCGIMAHKCIKKELQNNFWIVSGSWLSQITMIYLGNFINPFLFLLS